MRLLIAAFLCSVLAYRLVFTLDKKSTTTLIGTYGNVSAAIARYFSSACIYLITPSETQDDLLLIMTAKYISLVFKRPNTVASFAEYYHMLNTTENAHRCYVPLQVVIDSGESNDTREAFSKHSHRTSMHGTDQYGGGVWLVFLNSFDEKFVEKYFQIINTPFDIELIVAWVDEELVHLKEVYRVIPAYPIRQPYLGNWSVSTGLRAPRDPLHYSRRYNLEGLVMNVGYVDNPPYAIMEKTEENEDYLGGYFGDIWHVLESAMNVSSKLIKIDEFGTHYEADDRWTGLLGEIKHNKVDIAVADFFLTRNRFEIMDFSFPLSVTEFQIFFQNPGSKLEANALFLPFRYDLWVTIGCWIVVGAVVLYGGCYVSDSVMDTVENLNFYRCFFFMLGALCAQGSADVPKKVSCRILFFLPFIITAVVIPSYSASLISYLTTMPSLIPFSDMKEFYEKGFYKMLVRKESYEYDIFAYGATNDPFIRKIFERDLENRNKEMPKSYEDALTVLCKNKRAAFFGVEDAMRWILDNTEHMEKKMNGCSIAMMDHDAGKVTIGMAMPKKSHFKGLVNHHIRNFQSIGIMERLRRKHWVEYDKKTKEVWTPVNIQNTFMMFAIFGSGIGLGLVILSLEAVFRKSRESTKLIKSFNGLPGIKNPHTLFHYRRDVLH